MPFSTFFHPDRMEISDGTESIPIAPAEIEKARSLVYQALGMSKFKVLPGHIKGSPFAIEFKNAESGVSCKLVRKVGGPGVTFTYDSADELSEHLDMSLKQLIDKQRLGEGPRRGVSTINMPDPILEGRG